MDVKNESQPRRIGRWQVIWPLVIAGLIFSASSRSQVASPEVTNIDKFSHFGVYGLLGTLVCRLRGGWRGAGIGLAVAATYGALDEWHQNYTPGRSCELADWIADALGAWLAVTLYAGWRSYRELLETVIWSRATVVKAARNVAVP